jgi:hypothetical protein
MDGAAGDSWFDLLEVRDERGVVERFCPNCRQWVTCERATIFSIHYSERCIGQVLIPLATLSNAEPVGRVEPETQDLRSHEVDTIEDYYSDDDIEESEVDSESSPDRNYVSDGEDWDADDTDDEGQGSDGPDGAFETDWDAGSDDGSEASVEYGDLFNDPLVGEDGSTVGETVCGLGGWKEDCDVSDTAFDELCRLWNEKVSYLDYLL